MLTADGDGTGQLYQYRMHVLEAQGSRVHEFE